MITPGEIRDMLSEAGIDITAPSWPSPGYVVANGEILVPTDRPGVLRVNGEDRYSAAWR